VVCAGEMFEALQVRLPIAHVLIIKTVDDVFAQDKVWLIHIGLVVEQARGTEVAGDLFSVVAPLLEAQAGTRGTEIRVSANVIPVGVRDEDRRQFRQVR